MHISSAAGHIPFRPARIAHVLLLSERWRRLALAFAAGCPVLLPPAAAAYTAVGDRVFPATILLPQAAPADAIYVTPSTRPVSGGAPPI